MCFLHKTVQLVASIILRSSHVVVSLYLLTDMNESVCVHLDGSVVVVGGADAALFEVLVCLEQRAAQRVHRPLAQLAERHFEQDAITRRDQIHVRQTVRHRLAAIHTVKAQREHNSSNR